MFIHIHTHIHEHTYIHTHTHIWMHTYLHEIKESSLIVQYVNKVNVATRKNINLMLTIKITSQEIIKVPATKQLITMMFWKLIFNAHHLKPSHNYTCHLLHCFKTPQFVHAAHLYVSYHSHTQQYLFH